MHNLWKKYTYKYELNRHMKNCSQKMKCNECDQLICGKKNLKEHIRMKHAKEPLYECTICDEKSKFKYRSTLATRNKKYIQVIISESCTVTYIILEG